jgi:hypothetical protein
MRSEVRRVLTGEAGLEDTTVGQDLRECTVGGSPLLLVDVPLRRQVRVGADCPADHGQGSAPPFA